MRSKFFLATAALAGALFASRADADTVNAEIEGISPKLSVGIVVDNFHGFNYSNNSANAGLVHWFVFETTSDLFKKNQYFDGFCIEIRQGIDDSIFTVGSLDVAPDPDYPTDDAITGMGTTKANYLRELWGEFFDEIKVGTAAEQNTKAAAFQLAVWNIVYDSDFTVTGGTFYATSQTDAQTQADDWLSYINTHDGAMANLVALTNLENQDMVVELIHTPTPVAAGMGLSCLGLALMRRQRKA